jgi:ribosomal protein L5
MKIENFQHIKTKEIKDFRGFEKQKFFKLSEISCVLKTQSVFKDAKNLEDF